MSLFRNRLLWSLSIGHFATDLYPNILPIAFPLLMVSLNLSSYAQVAFVATMYTMTSSLSQPLFGYLADRFGGRILAPVGLVWLSILIGTLGYAPDYVSLIIIATLAGFGSGAFHPQGAMNASLMAGERKGTAVSIFMLGGNLGYSLGPVLGAVIFGFVGLHGTPLLIIPGILFAIWLYQAMEAVERHRKSVVADNTVQKTQMRVPILGVASLIVLIMLRSWSQGGVNNFLALLYKEKGISLETSSQVLFVMLVGIAVGAVIGGVLSDFVGRKKVTFISLVLLSPVVYTFLQTVPPLSFLVAFPTGILFGATYSITLIMVQELMPKNVGMASGLVLGLAFVTSGIGVSITGYMADNYGLLSALSFLSIMPFIGALLVLNYKPVPQAVAETT